MERLGRPRWDGLVPDVLFVLLTVGCSWFSPWWSGGRAAVSGENLVGLIVAVALIIFLIAALLFPERF